MKQTLEQNLFLIGRNGMYRFNRQDHPMLTALTALGGSIVRKVDYAGLWEVNTEIEHVAEELPE